MPIQNDLTAIVGTVAGSNFYLQALPEEFNLPCVIMRTIDVEQLPVLCQDQPKEAIYHMAFECRAETFAEAQSIATTVESLLDADTTIVKWPDDVPGEDFEPHYEEFLQPVYYGFHYKEV